MSLCDPPARRRAAWVRVKDAPINWTCAIVASRADCIAGRATFTTVASMNAMLEPRMAAVSVHAASRSLCLKEQGGAEDMTASSHGARTTRTSLSRLGLDD